MLDLYSLLMGRRALSVAQAAGRTADQATSSAEELNHRVRSLERAEERHTLILQAVIELATERLGVPTEQIAAKIAEIDLRDGVADGSMRARMRNCAKCGRVTNSKRPACLYCGEPASDETEPARGQSPTEK